MRYELQILCTGRDKSFMQVVKLLRENGFDVTVDTAYYDAYIVIDTIQQLQHLHDVCDSDVILRYGAKNLVSLTRVW